MTEKILIAQIVSSERMRKDLGDIDSLKESLAEHGLLQPIGVRPSPTTQGFFQVIWGGRRFEAATQLGWEDIECKILTCEEDYELREKELEENIRRKDMTWQEQAMSMYEIHDLKVRRNAIIGERWGYRETGQLLGISLGNVSYTLEVAKRLRTGDEEITEAPNLTEALRILVRRKEAELQEKKLSSGPAPSVEDVGFSQEDLEVMSAKPAAEAGEVAKEKRDYKVHITSEQPKDMKLLLVDSTIPHTEVFVPGSCHYLLRMIPRTTAPIYVGNISSFFVVKNEAGKADHGAFVPSLKVFGYNPPEAVHKNGQAVKPGMQPFYAVNCGMDEMLYGPHAVANSVWRTVLPNIVKAGDKVYIHSDLFGDAMFVLIMLGCEVWVADFVDLSVMSEQISKYGIQLNKEDHRPR
jgi:ParB-like chromosome segregation protein Spo0J